MNFWEKLSKNKKPFFCVAPMADVTDCAFRKLISKYGKPDVMWTEFVSANGLASQGKDILLNDLRYSEEERPIVAQLFTSDPKNMEISARLVQDLGFDGVDINMGCPDRTIEKQGAGACLIKTPDIAKALIKAVKKGAPNLPVSVKTRIGYNEMALDWIVSILLEGIDALTVHVRTRKELSKVPADWNRLKEVVKLKDKLAPNTLVIGNGDIVSLLDGKQKAKETGCDGVMVGRALFGNPWFFDEDREMISSIPKKRAKIIRMIPFLNKIFDTKRKAPVSAKNPISINERLNVLLEHTKLFEEMLGGVKSFSIMKKHYKAYVHGFPGSKELRISLMEAKNYMEVEERVNNFLSKLA